MLKVLKKIKVTQTNTTSLTIRNLINYILGQITIFNDDVKTLIF